MSSQSRLVAGILLIVLPTVEIGGASILSLLISDPQYTPRTSSGRTSGALATPTQAYGWSCLWWPCATWMTQPSLRA